MSVTGAHNWSESEQRAVRAQLDRIVNSALFHQSQRRRRFLEFLVVETLAGRGDRLKGYTIAVEVFDRPTSFDPVIDPIVRVEAGRLREKLRDYYHGEGESDPIHIDLPKGAYAPLFEFRQMCNVAQSGPAIAIAQTTPLAAIDGATAAANEVHEPGRKQNGIPRRPAVAAGIACLVVIGAIAWWGLGTRHQIGSADMNGAKGPVVAVLPFANLSGDPSQEYFSDGLTEDILTELSRTPDLVVLARNTTFQFKGPGADVAKLNRELKVDYVLKGSIQRSSTRIRITAQLIDARTGGHIWVDRFDRQMADVLVIQDEIVREIVSKIAGGYGVIENTEAKSSSQKSDEQIQAYDLVLRAHAEMWLWTHESFRSARELLDQAIAIDPANARVRREIAWLAIVGLISGLDKTPVPSGEIVVQASKAVQLDPSDGRAHMVAAAAHYFNKQLELFEFEAKQAIELAHYDAESLATLAYMTATSGDWSRGVEMAEKANALNADASAGWYHATLYLNYYLVGDYEQALKLKRQDPNQETLYSYVDYLPILGALGRKDEAREQWQKILNEDPNWTAQSFIKWYKTWNIRDEDTAKFMAGIYKTGVLEVVATPDR
ncbi:hypothetical protein [Hyphomicrobium sp.]|uniref:hypothetical protein n=1 Tax=Hyphomicrobium sp. TaxID=82 RepID=UPI003566F0F6